MFFLLYFNHKFNQIDKMQLAECRMQNAKCKIRQLFAKRKVFFILKAMFAQTKQGCRGLRPLQKKTMSS